VIDASEDLQRQRASLRDNVSLQQINSIMNAQLSRTERNQRADDIVVNHGDLADLYQQLQAVHQQYLHLSKTC